jgi:hypothetical protein
MKPVVTFLACLICIQLFACCNKSSEVTSNAKNVLHTDSMKLKITTGTNTFTATLYHNATVTAFKTRLPMTINMIELNGNEKYLMLYGSTTLVLFYKSFSTSYCYTPMGRIDDASGLTSALGSGNVTVTFALQ